MKKLEQHYNIILSLMPGAINFVFQVQFYDAETFVRERHWGISFGLWWPPFVILTDGVKP